MKRGPREEYHIYHFVFLKRRSNIVSWCGMCVHGVLVKERRRKYNVTFDEADLAGKRAFVSLCDIIFFYTSCWASNFSFLGLSIAVLWSRSTERLFGPDVRFLCGKSEPSNDVYKS